MRLRTQYILRLAESTAILFQGIIDNIRRRSGRCIERFHAEDQSEPFINGEVAVAFATRDSLSGYAETSWLDGTRKTPLMLDRFRTQI
jgi:hypothetical protein